MERWVGKVALVTGASAGIGASIAEELAKAGLKVVGLARRVEKVVALKSTLPKDVKGELIALKGDVSNLEDIEEAFRFIKEKFGTIHVLVNNAGIGRNGTISEGDIKLMQEVVNVNLIGLTACTQQAIKLMRATGIDDGHIININSIAGHHVLNLPEPTFNVYSATKFAVTALTETVRQELRFFKTKIRVTSISPGVVATEIGEASALASGTSKEAFEEQRKKFSIFPKLEPKDIADGVIYALSTPPHVQIHELTIKPVGEPF